MLWQRESGRTDPATRNRGTKPFWARMNDRLHISLSSTPWKSRIHRLFVDDPSSPMGAKARRTAVATLSGLLLLSALAFGFGSQRGSLESESALNVDANPPAPIATLHEDGKSVSAEPQPTPLKIFLPLLKNHSANNEPEKSEPAKTEPTKSSATAKPVTLKLDPLPEWVQSSKETTLWSRPDGQAKSLTNLPENTNLMVLGKAEADRLPVRFESADPAGPKVSGWVAISDLQAPSPPIEPSRIVASSRGARPTPDITSNDKFILAVSEAAQVSQLDSKVPASVTIAQAILESDWGRSLLSKKGQNYFGIKAHSGPGPAGIINMNTWEVLGGVNVTVRDGFKAYHNLWESVMDHGRFLAGNSRYARAFNHANNPIEFARQIHLAGYATDPAYTTKLVNLMQKFNLFQYDIK